MKGSGKLVKSMGWGILPSKMEVIIKDNFIPTKFMEREHTTGKMRRSMKGSGSITKWREVAS